MMSQYVKVPKDLKQLNMIKNVIIGFLSAIVLILSTSSTKDNTLLTAKQAATSTVKFDYPSFTRLYSLNDILSPLKNKPVTINFKEFPAVIASTLKLDTINVIDSISDLSNKPRKVLYHYKHDALNSPVKHVTHRNHTDSEQQWFAFDSTWQYNHKKIAFTERELNMFTNILCRESRSCKTREQEIDCYFVAIVMLRKTQTINCTTASCMLKAGGFSYTQAMYDRTAYNEPSWVKCREILKNVFSCRIPSYVPYLPHGTFYYWNSRLDRAWPWRKRLEQRCINVASTVKDHHYFVQPDAMANDEKAYLYERYTNHIVNPINKNIANGNHKLLLCK